MINPTIVFWINCSIYEFVGNDHHDFPEPMEMFSNFLLLFDQQPNIYNVQRDTQEILTFKKMDVLHICLINDLTDKLFQRCCQAFMGLRPVINVMFDLDAKLTIHAHIFAFYQALDLHKFEYE